MAYQYDIYLGTRQMTPEHIGIRLEANRIGAATITKSLGYWNGEIEEGYRITVVSDDAIPDKVEGLVTFLLQETGEGSVFLVTTKVYSVELGLTDIKKGPLPVV